MLEASLKIEGLGSGSGLGFAHVSLAGPNVTDIREKKASGPQFLGDYSVLDELLIWPAVHKLHFQVSRGWDTAQARASAGESVNGLRRFEIWGTTFELGKVLIPACCTFWGAFL